ncbi:MAG: DUF4184 family protein [Candidatus Nanopelagicales bacterium]
MPFTGSHPAAILPLLRLGLPASALVIGSVSPDFPYYLRLPVSALDSHGMAGGVSAAATSNLLLGLAAFLMWHILLAPPLFWLAPSQLQRRIPDRLRGGISGRLTTAGDLARIACAVLIGAATHIGLDSLTHADMWGPRTYPVLNTVVFWLPLHRWLQYTLSVAGLVALIWAGWSWWRTTPAHNPATDRRMWLRWALTLLIGAISLLATAGTVGHLVIAPGPINPQTLLISALLTLFSKLTISLLVFAAGWHLSQGLRLGERERGAAWVRDPG